MKRWYSLRGKQLLTSSQQETLSRDILFFVQETSKLKAMIVASQVKTLYMLQHPNPDNVQFDFENQTSVNILENGWTPAQMKGIRENAIVIVAPYASNQEQLIEINATASQSYTKLLHTSKEPERG